MENNTQKDVDASEQEINRHLLRYLRESHEMTHEQLAQEINVEPQLVKTWETGRRKPNQKQQFALEKYFGIKDGYLASDLKHILLQDFTAAYFGDTQARERLEWTEQKRKLGQSLDILPAQPKKRAS
jgi:ribosome-binding protein aMBF1 (putative translation factor)